MTRIAIALTYVLMIVATPVFAGTQNLNDFLETPGQANNVETIGVLLLSQSNPLTAEHDANQLRKRFWAVVPEAKVSRDAADLAVKDFDHDFADVADIVRAWNIKSCSLAGIDLVLLSKTQDWYFAAPTVEGPVLIKLSLQFYDDKPMTIHGIHVYTKWDEVKSISHAIQLPALDKVFTVNLDSKAASGSNAAPKD